MRGEGGAERGLHLGVLAGGCISGFWLEGASRGSGWRVHLGVLAGVVGDCRGVLGLKWFRGLAGFVGGCRGVFGFVVLHALL